MLSALCFLAGRHEAWFSNLCRISVNRIAGRHSLVSGSDQAHRPPRFSDEVNKLFLPDAGQKAVDERPGGTSTIRSKAPKDVSEVDSSSENSGSKFAWSRLISADTLESEVKSLSLQVRQSVQSPSKFKGGGYNEARRQFSMLAVMFAIIAEYDGDVRWQKKATGMREVLARAGFNCKVGTDGSFNEARQRKEDLDKLIRGEPPQLSSGDAIAGWNKVADRSPLMQRLEKAFRQGMMVWASNAAEFKKNGEKLRREAELMAALAEIIGREGYEFSDDETYREHARQMGQAAQEVIGAVKQKNYLDARKALGDIDKACTTCHEGYRS